MFRERGLPPAPAAPTSTTGTIQNQKQIGDAMLRSLTIAALGGLLLPLVTFSAPAEAQERRIYRFCHVIYEGIGRYSHQSCTFNTFAQCMATRNGIGGQCDENPEWIAMAQQRQNAKRRPVR